jgi:hypothetical protein
MNGKAQKEELLKEERWRATGRENAGWTLFPEIDDGSAGDDKRTSEKDGGSRYVTKEDVVYDLEHDEE